MIFVILPIVWLLSIIEIFTGKKYYRLGSVLFFLLLSSNYYNGMDWLYYYDIYQSVDQYTYGSFLQSGVFEPLYSIFFKVSSDLGLDYHTFVISVSLLNALLMWQILKRVSNPNTVLMVILAFAGIVLFSERIRQGVSVLIVTLGTLMMISRRGNKFIILYLIAPLFHYSALVEFLYPLFSRRSLKSVIYIISALSILSLCTLFVDNTFLIAKLNSYFEISSSFIGFGLLFDLIILYVCVYCSSKNTDSQNEYTTRLIKISVFASVIYVFIDCVFRFFPQFLRLKYYFIFFVAIIFSHLIQQQRKFASMILTHMALTIMCVIYFFRLLNDEYSAIWIDFYDDFYIKTFSAYPFDPSLKMQLICAHLISINDEFCQYLPTGW